MIGSLLYRLPFIVGPFSFSGPHQSNSSTLSLSSFREAGHHPYLLGFVARIVLEKQSGQLLEARERHQAGRSAILSCLQRCDRFDEQETQNQCNSAWNVNVSAPPQIGQWREL